jgi:hypothetical protein
MKIVEAANAPARLTLGVVRTGPYNDLGVSVKTDAGGEVDRNGLGKRLLRRRYEGRQTYQELRTGESLKEERTRASDSRSELPHIQS